MVPRCGWWLISIHWDCSTFSSHSALPPELHAMAFSECNFRLAHKCIVTTHCNCSYPHLIFKPANHAKNFGYTSQSEVTFSSVDASNQDCLAVSYLWGKAVQCMPMSTQGQCGDSPWKYAIVLGTIGGHSHLVMGTLAVIILFGGCSLTHWGLNEVADIMHAFCMCFWLSVNESAWNIYAIALKCVSKGLIDHRMILMIMISGYGLVPMLTMILDKAVLRLPMEISNCPLSRLSRGLFYYPEKHLIVTSPKCQSCEISKRNSNITLKIVRCHCCRDPCQIWSNGTTLNTNQGALRFC